MVRDLSSFHLKFCLVDIWSSSVNASPCRVASLINSSGGFGAFQLHRIALILFLFTLNVFMLCPDETVLQYAPQCCCSEVAHICSVVVGCFAAYDHVVKTESKWSIDNSIFSVKSTRQQVNRYCRIHLASATLTEFSDELFGIVCSYSASGGLTKDSEELLGFFFNWAVQKNNIVLESLS